MRGAPLLLAALLLAGLLPAATSTGDAWGDADAPVQPGNLVTNARCTVGFVVHNASGVFFLTASHCVADRGTLKPEFREPGSVEVEGQRVGTVVHWARSADDPDVALVRVESCALANPRVLSFGGPYGTTVPTLGTLVGLHGHGVDHLGGGIQKRARTGEVTLVEDHKVFSTILVYGGDSGAPVVASFERLAVGIQTGIDAGASHHRMDWIFARFALHGHHVALAKATDACKVPT